VAVVTPSRRVPTLFRVAFFVAASAVPRTVLRAPSARSRLSAVAFAVFAVAFGSAAAVFAIALPYPMTMPRMRPRILRGRAGRLVPFEQASRVHLVGLVVSIAGNGTDDGQRRQYGQEHADENAFRL